MANWLHLPEASVNLDHLAYVDRDHNNALLLHLALPGFGERFTHMTVELPAEKEKEVLNQIGRQDEFPKGETWDGNLLTT